MNDLVIEIRGGVLVGVYGRSDTRAKVVDWDDVAEGGEQGTYVLAPDPLSAMPPETRHLVESSREGTRTGC